MKRVSGLDGHKDSVYRCVLQENGDKMQEKYGNADSRFVPMVGNASIA